MYGDLIDPVGGSILVAVQGLLVRGYSWILKIYSGSIMNTKHGIKMGNMFVAGILTRWVANVSAESTRVCASPIMNWYV